MLIVKINHNATVVPPTLTLSGVVGNAVRDAWNMGAGRREDLIWFAESRRQLVEIACAGILDFAHELGRL